MAPPVDLKRFCEYGLKYYSVIAFVFGQGKIMNLDLSEKKCVNSAVRKWCSSFLLPKIWQSENKYSPFAGLRWWMIEFFMKNTKIVDFYIFIELL